MFDLRKSVILLMIIVTVLTLSVLSCKKTGTLLPNQKPVVEITSYEGKVIDENFAEDPSVIDTMVNEKELEKSLFQQKIFWSAYDVDGEVTGYAFRVKDINDNAIRMAGYEAIDEDGWVYHYREGADQSQPLMSIDGTVNKTIATIWTNVLSTTVNFPANANADSSNTPNIFELKCKDNRESESDITRRVFLSYSEIPEVLVTTSKGNVENRDTGTGLRFKFSINDNDPFIPATPYFYKYRVFKVDKDTEEPVDTSSVDYKTWYSTINYPRLDEVNLCGVDSLNKPLLKTDYADSSQTVQLTATRLEVVAYDLAGIESESETVTFRVHNNYSPETKIYEKTTRALGENHFMYIQPQDIVVENTESNEGTRFAMELFKDKNDINSVLWSHNLKLYFAWGYKGEYEEDDPTKKQMNTVVDAAEGSEKSYYAEILYFDIRMETANGPKLDMIPELRSSTVTDEDGTTWVRIPKAHSNSQKLTLNNFDPNSRDADDYTILYIRAVDNQYKVDDTPVEYKFKAVEPKPYEERHNCFIMYDQIEFGTVMKQDVINERYDNMLSKYVDADTLFKIDNGNYRQSALSSDRIVSPADVCDYKVMIIANEKLQGTQFSENEYDMLRMFSHIGGNIVYISGTGLTEAYGAFQTDEMISSEIYETYSFFRDEFGLQSNLHYSYTLAEHGETIFSRNNAFFKGAVAAAGFNMPDVNVLLPTEASEYGGLVYVQNGNQQKLPGVGAVLKTPESAFESVMMSSPLDSEDRPSDGLALKYYNDISNGSVIARYRKAPTVLNPRIRTNYIIGFSPTLMEQDKMKEVMEKIMDDILQY